MKRLVGVLILLAAAGAAYYAWARFSPVAARRLDVQTVALSKADVRRVVSTSGSVKARVQVDVGTQLSGQISQLGANFNDKVRKGDVLARIDPATFEAKVRSSEAAIAVAEASAALAGAGIEKANANLAKANADLERARTLAASGTGSRVAVDNAEVARNTAAADLTTAKAQLDNANALIKQRRAELESARIDLDRTFIRSPIDGVVIDRAIELGQTVSASLSAPKLFTLAEDLAKVEIGAGVDEADIGQVAARNAVSFTVDAYPDMRFAGTVEQVRLAPTTQANVVTYTVVILAENTAGRLLPGMTANVEITTGERRGVLAVPNEALRFQPRGAAAAIARPAGGGAGEPAVAARPRSGPGGAGGEMLARLQEELKLDAATMEKIRTGLRTEFAGLRQGQGQGRGQGGQSPGGQGQGPRPGGAAGEDGGGPAEGAGAELRAEFRARTEKVFREALTPEQFDRYQEIVRSEGQAPRTATVWTREADGTLAPHRVRLGLADASRTELTGGDLAEGAALVVRVRETPR